MKMKTLALAILLLIFTACFSQATIVWNPSGTYPDEAYWDVGGNWNTGQVPGEDNKAIIRASVICVLNSGADVDQLSVGDGGDDGASLRIVDGGSLFADGTAWSAVGYNRDSTVTIESGGLLETTHRVLLGRESDSHLIVDGGTAVIGGHLQVGNNGGFGRLTVGDGGLVDIAGDVRRNGDMLIDVRGGTIIIDGDKTGFISSWEGSEIVAYGGAGILLFDYNATHPGKTTIQAMEQEVLEGDITEEGRVNIEDLKLFVDDWLIDDCDSPAHLDGPCLINFRDFSVLANSWLRGFAPYWHVVETVYPTDDVIVTPYAAQDFGIVADGVTDVTDEIQTALILIDNMGGGTLFLPAGNYRVEGTLTVPPRVTLRGDWKQPKPGSEVAGTILQAYAGRGDENADPFIRLIGSAGIKNLSIWYPEQEPDNIQPYPPTLHIEGSTVENLTFVNSYFGATTFREGMTRLPFMRNVYGTPLKTGIEFDRLSDIGRIETVHFSPDYWADSGLANAPAGGEHEDWIYNNGTGVIVRAIAWSYSAYVTVERYNIGFALRPTRYDRGSPNGQSYKFNLVDCQTGIYIEESANAGYQFTRFNIQGAETGVYISSAVEEANMFHTCSIDASGDAISGNGTAGTTRLMMMSCDIRGPVKINGGYFSVSNSYFENTGNHIEIGSDVYGATIQGNTFDGTPQIVNNTSYPVEIDHSAVSVDTLPEYDFRKPETAYKPAKTDLFVVTESPYDAAADGVTDDTAAFQSALADAEANGGGVVFVPGGDYRLEGNLVVPTGVELRGIFDGHHETRHSGSMLNVYAGRNDADGTPFIQLESGSGLRGLDFHYPEQIYDENDDDPETGTFGFVPYPYLIRGLGSDIYVINIAATIPYQLLDLATYQCDRHYVDYIYSTALKTGVHIGGGTKDGHLHNCQLNPAAYTHQGNYYDSIPLGTVDNVHELLWRDATAFLFGDMSEQVLHKNFVFGGAKGVHTVEEDGFGPSGYSLGFGVDQCTNAFQIDHIGSDGLDMINSQLVTIDREVGRYLETGASLDDTFRMFSCAGWGPHQYSAAIYGGDVRLQLFHIADAGEGGAFKVSDTANLQNVGGNLKSHLPWGRPFLTVEPDAAAEFIGNIINTVPGQMPSNTTNVTSRGNIRVQ